MKLTIKNELHSNDLFENVNLLLTPSQVNGVTPEGFIQSANKQRTVFPVANLHGWNRTLKWVMASWPDNWEKIQKNKITTIFWTPIFGDNHLLDTNN